eukprot:15436640-Alexandrium_andersonii.AAC.1
MNVGGWVVCVRGRHGQRVGPSGVLKPRLRRKCRCKHARQLYSLGPLASVSGHGPPTPTHVCAGPLATQRFLFGAGAFRVPFVILLLLTAS